MVNEKQKEAAALPAMAQEQGVRIGCSSGPFEVFLYG